MYTILVNDDNTLSRTKVEQIMEKSTNVNQLHFLGKPLYHSMQGDEIDMTDFSCILEYKLPISHEYHSEALVATDGLYKDAYIEYILPVNTQFTKEAGNIELQLSFTDVYTRPDGTNVPRVRKTQPTMITITPISDWSNLVPDAALTAIDQRLIAMDSLVRSLNMTINQYQAGQAASLSLEGDTLYLVKSDGEKIGKGIKINSTMITETNGMMNVVHI